MDGRIRYSSCVVFVSHFAFGKEAWVCSLRIVETSLN